MITIEDFSKVEIKAGKIISAETIEGSDKLLKLKVDFGNEGEKQVVSGIKKYFTNEQELVGTTCAFVTNLEPREMMGLRSEAMILASSGEKNGEKYFSLLEMKCPAGSKIK